MSALADPTQRLTVDGRDVTITSLDRVLYPAVGFTKGQLVDYYRSVAPAMVRHLAGRPVMLGRWPSGVEGRGWGQFDCRGPQWMRTHRLERRGGGQVGLCVIDDAAGLVWAANQGAIEFHPYLARTDAFDEPIAVIFDLDPGSGVGLLECAEVALRLREVLTDIGLQSFAKTSGGDGLHVLVPLNAPHRYSDTKRFARGLAERLAAERPDRVVAVMDRSHRAGRVYVDWVQNDARRQSVAAYSLRAAEAPRVSTPVLWSELEHAVAARDGARLVFTADKVVRRLASIGDPIEPVATLRQRLPER